jgi:hypothetical protein
MHLGGLTDLPEEALMSRPAWRQQQKKPGVGRRETESVAAPTRDEGKEPAAARAVSSPRKKVTPPLTT